MNNRQSWLFAAFVTIAIFPASYPFAIAGSTPLTTTRIASGLSRPLYVVAPPDDFNRVFIVEQRSATTGRIRVFDLTTETLLETPYLVINNVSTAEEQGLLGLAFHPDFQSNGYFYVNYTGTGGFTNIVRYQANPPYATSTTADPTPTPILSITQPFVNHNGGWIAFGPDGYLYIATGDGGSANDPGNRAQNTTLLLGKMLRIDVNGDDFPADPARNYAIPPDNPFAGGGGAAEIWAYGLRNPWRPSFDRATGDLWIADVGQNNFEEINFQPAGGMSTAQNYGWRCMEGNNCTGLSGCTCDVNCTGGILTCPIYQYTHATDGFSCSITGGYVYRGAAIPDLQGTYFFADYCSNRIKSFRYDSVSISEFTNRTDELAPIDGLDIRSISSFGEDASGEMYICDLTGGEVFRIVPAGSPPAPTKIEVLVDGDWLDLHKAVVPTPTPLVRITRGVEIPSNFSIRLTRQDGRAGYLGAGKALSRGPLGSGSVFEEVSPDVYVGTVATLVGRNSIELLDSNGNLLLLATMLNFTQAFEDLNGNGLLDPDEDANENGALDPGEDLNSNELLDVTEDFNDNGQLDIGEDLNGNHILDDSEDMNGNGILDAYYIQPVDPILSEYAVFHSDLSLDVHENSVLLVFDVAATAAEITRYIQGVSGSNIYDTEPMGLVFNSLSTTLGLMVTVQFHDATMPYEVARILNGQSSGDYALPPPAPAAYPLRYALVNAMLAPAVIAGERMPARMVAGAAPNAGEGYSPATGAFDNDGDRSGFDNDADGNNDPADELDLFWPHYAMQIFPAHALALRLPFAAAPSAVAVVDSGFGNGANAPADIPADRIYRPHNHHVTPATPAGPGFFTVGPFRFIRWSRFADTDNHGTWVASCSSAGNGALALGTGFRTPVRPIRIDPAFTAAVLVGALQTAAAEASTSVVNLSWRFRVPAPNAAVGRARAVAARATLLAGIQQLIAQNKIVVIAAGNESEDTERALPVAFTCSGFAGTAINDDGDGMTDEDDALGLDGADSDPVPDARVDEDPPEYAGAIAVAATGVVTIPIGPERYAGFSNFGARVMLSAPGQHINAIQNVPAAGGNPASYAVSGAGVNGTSFAAPRVAGAIAELDNIAAALADPAGGLFSAGALSAAQRRLRVMELVIASSDDLGNTGGGGGVNSPNNNAGNGPDTLFGNGRLNLWKAMLSVANEGLARQPARPDADTNNRDDRFTNLPLINDANTRWYGFEIYTAEPHAEVWIDGEKLTDANATTPNAPDITAYAGVKTHVPNLVRGVHIRGDGSSTDVGNTVLEEEPLAGMVPDGTSLANRGLFVIRFSARRTDLYDGANPKTLSLRRRNAGVNSKPFYNLLLETAKMREEGNAHVSGVVFDDFVFQITVPDYGDAPYDDPDDLAKSSTLMTQNGARHINTALEWLGRPGAANYLSVTGEVNAEAEALSGNPRVDADGVDNRYFFHDRDGRDDGVVFFPLTYEALSNTGKVQFTIGVADKNDPRYAPQGAEPNPNPDRQLYFNLWIDWDNNGIWEEINHEHVLNGVAIRPRNAGTWEVISSGTSGATVTCISTTPDRNYATFESTDLRTGLIGCGAIWARARLDYGENVGRNDPRPLFRSLPSLRDPAWAPGVFDPGNQRRLGLARGAARYGEVEDYFIGSDFGDAPDDGLGNYATLFGTGGARHLDFHQEWLGVCCLPLATREIDADDTNIFCGGDDFGTDQDGESNLNPEDTDNLDDGVVITVCGPCGPGFSIDVTITSSIAARGGILELPGGSIAFPEDDADTLPRYDVLDVNRLLYLKGWIDWNNNGGWDDDGELVINEVIDPMDFGPDNAYTLGEPFTDSNQNGVWDPGEPYTDIFGINTATFNYTVFAGVAAQDIPQKLWFRFRLNYGEPENAVALPVRACDEDARFLDGPRGGALFGEVEDYVVITDDTCWFPRHVSEGNHAFDTTGYSGDGPVGPCGGVGPDIWFAYTASCTGTAFVSTCNNLTQYDTVIDAYEGVDCPPPTYIDCNDDGPNLCPPQSSLSFPVVAGQTYMIRVAGKLGVHRGPGRLDIHCKPAGPVLYVNHAVIGGNQSGSDWANAVPTLTRALELAALSYDPGNPNGGLNVQQIWVAQGTYKPTADLDRNKRFNLISGVAHLGGFNGTEINANQRNPVANPTILSGDLLGNDAGCFNNADNSYHVVWSSGASEHTLLDGFTITGGNANGQPPFDVNGGGMYIEIGTPRIRNCDIVANSAARAGGGIYINELAYPVISYCTVAYNCVPGNCGNCGGGGIYTEGDSYPYIVNCAVYENEAPASNGGGVFFRQGPNQNGAVLHNSVVYNNVANAGGGICIALHHGAAVINCTVAQNSATQFGGGMFVFRCNPYTANNIFWFNASPLGAEWAIPFCPSNPTIENSNIQGGVPAMHLGPPAGGGNCNPNVVGVLQVANPLLAADLDLIPGSPCIDAGANAAVPAIDPADLDGDGIFMESTPIDFKARNRIVNNTVDIGAHEVPDNSDPYGACCYQDGSCELTTRNGCTGRWIGAGVPCDPDPCEIPCCPGDVNRDGAINNFDIDPFVVAIVNGLYSCETDLNCDGFINNFDIDPFVLAIINSECGYCP